MLGPHFYYDLIRMARKGWTSLLRCFYVLVLLIGLGVIGKDLASGALSYNAYARTAEKLAYSLILLQYVLILVVAPVYVGGALIEEKERRTLELLFTTHLTDVEIVLGKVGARYVSLAAVVLASLPLLAFVQLWGGVDMAFLALHFGLALLFLLVACSVCVWASAECDELANALLTSYSLLAAIGLPVVLLLVPTTMIGSMTLGQSSYLLVCLIAAPSSLALAALPTWFAICRVRDLRTREPSHPLRKPHAAVVRRRREPRLAVPRRQRRPSLPLPIHGSALVWKEFLKGGIRWSSWWLVIGLGAAVLVLVAARLVAASRELHWAFDYLTFLGAFGTYALGLLTYATLVSVRVTGSVVRERQQNTLDFLLLLPVPRAEILVCKWLGPFWRAWPALAIAYAGVLFGWGCDLYGAPAALLLVLLPWPLVVMLSLVGLFLSVSCRRVLSATLLMAACVALLLGMHLLLYDSTVLVYRFYGEAIHVSDLPPLSDEERSWAWLMAVGEQAVFLVLATLFGAAAFLRF